MSNERGFNLKYVGNNDGSICEGEDDLGDITITIELDESMN